MDWNETTLGLATALGLGLLIGVIRERRHEPANTVAGTRTHTLLALLGAIAWIPGLSAFVAALLVVGALAVASHLRSAPTDPGLTSEVTIVVTFALGGLAIQNPALAAAIGVLVAILLHAKQPLQHFSREWISERELSDALLLAAAALVVMPILPTRAIDPWGVLFPTTIWRIVVLVMAVGMLGHIAMRAIGANWGLPLAGFFSGFASSTAAVAGLGSRARTHASLSLPAASAALLANLASLLLFSAVLGAASPGLLASMSWPLSAAGASLLLIAAFGLRRSRHDAPAEAAPGGAFKLSHALFIAGVIAAVLLLAAWLGDLFGEVGVLTAAVLVALAEVHAAAASIAQLHASGGLGSGTSHWGVIAVLAASALSKSVIAFISGGRRYGTLVASGLLLMVAAAALTTWIFDL